MAAAGFREGLARDKSRFSIRTGGGGTRGILNLISGCGLVG